MNIDDLVEMDSSIMAYDNNNQPAILNQGLKGIIIDRLANEFLVQFVIGQYWVNENDLFLIDFRR